MDIKVSESSLRQFLNSKADISQIIDSLCTSGPTVDRFHKVSSDTIMEIEVITNRIDSASVFGIAREANAILNQNKVSSKLTNNPYTLDTTSHDNQTSILNFQAENPELIKRFTALSIDGVEVTPSPQKTIDLLSNSDQRSLNNLIDATNEFTLLYGIPSHVFDKDKLALQKLIIREAKKDEVLFTLDNSKILLQPGDIVIEDGQGRLVDLCGVMGGQVGEVDEHTKNIILIVPVYNPKKIRKTSLFHQKRTLAAQIYEKGPDPELAPHILNILSQTIIDRAGGNISSKLFDLNHSKLNPKQISLDTVWLSSFVGATINNEDIITILTNLGFNKTLCDGTLISTDVPSFRYNDINTREDLAEEISRIYGFSNISPSLPPLTKPPVPTDTIFQLERKIKNILANEGFNEVYNSSLISKSQIEKSCLNPLTHLKLKNALSEDLEYLRTTLVPNALQNHSNNKGKSKNTLKFFELSNTYLPKEDGLAEETSTLIFSSSEEILKLKSVLEKLFTFLNYPNYEFIQGPLTTSYLDQTNSAEITVNSHSIGYIGQISPKISRSFGINETISVVEINISYLNKLAPTLSFTPISLYPALKQDITVTSTKNLGEIIKSIYNLDKNIINIKFKESFKTNHTFEISIESQTQNLTQQDSEIVREKILKAFPKG